MSIAADSFRQIRLMKPAKLAGEMSEGMLICAQDENGKLGLLTPERDMPSGAEIS